MKMEYVVSGESIEGDVFFLTINDTRLLLRVAKRKDGKEVGVAVFDGETRIGCIEVDPPRVSGTALLISGEE